MPPGWANQALLVTLLVTLLVFGNESPEFPHPGHFKTPAQACQPSFLVEFLFHQHLDFDQGLGSVAAFGVDGDDVRAGHGVCDLGHGVDGKAQLRAEQAGHGNLNELGSAIGMMLLKVLRLKP